MKDFLNRILPSKAEIGFFQEWDIKTNKLTNSSTRLFQMAFMAVFFVNTYFIHDTVKHDADFNIYKGIFLGSLYVINMTAVLAPKMLKDKEVITAFLAQMKSPKNIE